MRVNAKRSRTSVTPEEAKRIWESQREPTPTTVARALTQAGRRVDSQTSRPQRRDPLDIAEDRLDAALPLLTGDPTSSVRSLLKMQETAQIAEHLDEDQRRRLQIRALRTAGIVISLELARRADDLVSEQPVEFTALFKAVLSAFKASVHADGHSTTRSRPVSRDSANRRQTL
jgi:hypothetical protein